MHRLPHNVVDTGSKKVKGVVEGFCIVHGDDGSGGTGLDLDRDFFAVVKISEQKGFNGIDIWFGSRVHPLAKIMGRQTGRGNSLAAKPGGVAIQDSFAFIDYDDHECLESWN
jgi:hypothetical protein